MGIQTNSNQCNQSSFIPLLLVCCGALSAYSAHAEPLNVSIKQFGAIGDGVTADTVAIQNALDKVAGHGGGVVELPAGKYLSGSLLMGSHTTLQLDSGALLLGTSNAQDYPVVRARWEGIMRDCHRALISSTNATDIAVTGSGVVQGNPDAQHLRDPRGPVLFEAIECTNVRLQDFTTHSFAMWGLHPTFCKNVQVSGLKIENKSGNGDGLDPDSCQHVMIDHCTFSTTDDCIAIKSGKGQEGVKIGCPCEDITITNCTFLKGNAGVTFGSELSGGIKDVHIANCTFEEGHAAIMLKQRPTRGGYVQNITAEHLIVGPEPLIITNLSFQNLIDPQGVQGPAGITQFGGIHISDVQIASKKMLDVRGTPAKPLDGLDIENVHGTCAQGSSIQDAKNVVLKGIQITGITGPALVTKNVQGTGLDGAVSAN